MIAAEPVAAVILESGSPGGHPETRVSATGCPGIAASSPVLILRNETGPLATAAVADLQSHDYESAAGFGKCGTRLRALSG